MTTFEDVKPTAGPMANSYEWLYDVNTGTTEAPIWSNIPDITGLAPNPTPTMADDTTYANKGQQAQVKVGEGLAIDFQVKPVADPVTHLAQPAVELLLAAADGVDEDNVIEYRYYSARFISLAYQGTATVSWSRANTGNADPERFGFSLTGRGDRVRIANPEFADES